MGEDVFDGLMVARASAYWAGASAIAAWLLGLMTLALNGVGLWALWHQLQLNRRALKYASDSAIAASKALKINAMVERAWLRVSLSKAGLWVQQPRQDTLRVTIKAKNIGHTPASNVWLTASMIDLHNTDRSREILQQNAAQANWDYIGQTLFPGEKATSDTYFLVLFPEHDGFGSWCIGATAQYRIAGQPEGHYSVRIYDVVPGARLTPDEILALGDPSITAAHHVRISPAISLHVESV